MRSLLSAVRSAAIPRTLLGQLLLLVGLLVVLHLVLSGVLFGRMVADMLGEQIGARAMGIAETMARNPVVRNGVLRGDPEGEVQALAESVRTSTGAEFVVVCDRHSRRLSHPDAWKIGQTFVGGDEGAAVAEGRSYVSRAVGTLGPSLRGFAPVRDGGDVVGFVAVGYLLRDVNRAILRRQLQPWALMSFMGLAGWTGAVLIARHFKRSMLGLEPQEIASLYLERGVILESLREGVLSVDRDGTIRLVNAAALRSLGVEAESGLVGRSVEDIVPRLPLDTVLAGGDPVFDREVMRDGVALVFTLVPIRNHGRVEGAVASFRRKDEIDRLARQLSQARAYSELLRVQAHEHSNQLHTIAGLIQIGANHEALELILSETSDYDDLIQLLQEAVPHPMLSGLILGKCHRARELKVILLVDPECSMRDVPGHIDPERLVTIVGNLLDNALEAAVAGTHQPGFAQLSMTDLGHDLVFEVEDSGPGIASADVERIFEYGVTTKGKPGHGVGLYLVRQQVEALGGQVSVGVGDYGGALFTVIIPKRKAAPS